MNFNQALSLLFRQGYKIRRKSWGKPYFIYLSVTDWPAKSYPCFGPIGIMEPIEFYSPCNEDFEATDWEIYNV